MGKKEQRNITSLTNSSANAFQVNKILLQALNKIVMQFVSKHYYRNTKLSIKKLLINSVMTYVLFTFNGGFHLRMYRFSLYSLRVVFVS